MTQVSVKDKNIKSLLVLFDAEGSTEIVNWQELATDWKHEKPTPLLKKSLRNDINALLQGAKIGGVENVYLIDGHSIGNNIDIMDLSSNGLNLILENESSEILEKYAKKSDFAVLMCYHGKYRSNDRVPPLLQDEFEKKLKTGLGHTFLFTIKNVYLNGISIGEAVFLTNVLKDLGLPVIFFTGSTAAINEVHKFYPEVQKVATKNGEKQFDFSIVRARIGDGIKNAILEAQLGKGFLVLDDPRLKYNSFMIEFKKSTNVQYKKVINDDLSYFKKLMGEFDLKITNKKVYCSPKNKSKPYFEIYRLLEKVMELSFGE